MLADPAAAALILQCHLDGDLDGNRSGIAEEHGLQTRRGDLDQQLGQPGRRRVGEAAEHDMVERGELAGQRGVQNGMAVAMHRGPPGAHRVEYPDLFTVADNRQPGALGVDGDDRRQRTRCTHSAVGMPHVRAVDGADLQGC